MVMNRILVIRGGAIGDFILTLPALKALREAYPDAHIEILGYKHIAALAENRFYAQVVRSIEYGLLSGFFATNSELSAELAGYFANFDLIISYLYDPDCIFENNLRRCGLENWIELFSSNGRFSGAKDEPGYMGKQLSLVVVSGEADQAQTAKLENDWKDRDVRFAKNLPLSQLAAVLEHTIFVGHDSGISHLAAAAGANCILLFGPTDPNVWAPRNENVQIVVAPSGKLEDLEIAPVQAPLTTALRGVLQPG